MCECHDNETEHEDWLATETAYWSAYFGDSVRQSIESERPLREDGIFTPLDSAETQYEIQRRLK